jgi:crotonobetainyl-CoA:carnitine CoA-transferase CaiB-like acyl-CoA transferase
MTVGREHLPLDGIRVLDASDALGAYGGRLLADFGADVIRLERPTGSPMRDRPPFVGDEPGADRSLAFLYYEANKRGVTLDVTDPASLDDLRALAAHADVVLITPSARTPVVGFDPDAQTVSWAPASAVVVSITPFGLTGPYRGWRATHLTSYALSGLMYTQGTPEGPPVVIPGDQMYAHVGTNAAITVLRALRARDQVGGQFADLSAHEIITSTLFGLHQYSAARMLGRRMPVEPTESGGVWRCSDGLVEFVVSTDKHWVGLVQLLGSPEALSDPALAHPYNRYQHRAEVLEVLRPAIAAIGREEFVARGQELGVPCALVNTIGEFVNDPQPRSRGFFVKAPLPDGTTVEMPGALYLSTEPILSLYDRPAPRLGELAVGDLLAEWSAPRALRASGRPLEGIRVVSFGTAIAGAFAGSVLADLGADVVKVEAPTRPDNLRRLWYPEETPVHEPSGADTSSMFANFNRTERSLSMDMKNPAAVELFLRIAAAADVVVDNFGPSVMDGWGLGWDQLSAANPALVQLSLTGFGHTEGPRSHYLAYGSTVCSFTGLSQAWGFSHGTHFDYVCEAHGVLGVLAALSARDVTGRGTYVDLAEVEAGGAVMGPLLLDYIVNGRDSSPVGNTVAGSVWSGVVRCAGDDRWLAVEAEDDDDWAALVTVIGRPELAETTDAAAREQLASALEGWVSAQTALQAARKLQAAGVAAAPVQDAEDIYRDPQLRARGAVVEVPHPDLGPIELLGPAHRLDKTPPRITAGAPRLGEHGDAVLTEWLGLGQGERDALSDAKAFWRG